MARSAAAGSEEVDAAEGMVQLASTAPRSVDPTFAAKPISEGIRVCPPPPPTHTQHTHTHTILPARALPPPSC